MNKELKELSESCASLCENLKQLKADMPVDPKNPSNDMMNKCMDAMYNIADNLHRRIDIVDQNHWQKMDNHISASTHLPKLTASQHEKLLKSCGASEDYQVQKPTIWARNRQGNAELVVDLSKKS